MSGRAAFPLLRYFLGVGLGCILVVAVPLGYFMDRYSQDALDTLAEERNAGYAGLISNSLWPSYRKFALTAPKLTAAQLRAAPESWEMYRRIAEMAIDTGVLKVKIYSPEGYLFFSTEPSQIGAIQSDNQGVLMAASGRVVSQITHRNKFDTFERTVVDRDVLASYMPIREGERVVAVFELYSDITPFVGQMKRLRNVVLASVAIAMLLLYGLLSYLIWKANRIIDRQQASLEENNRTLETRVAERTHAIASVNDKLRTEMAERIRAETDLRLAATVFESTGEGVVIAGPDQKVIAVNRAFTDITGYTFEEAVGNTPRMLKSGRQGDAFYLSMWKSLNERGQWAGEIWNRRKCGEVYPEWLSLSAVRDDAGSLTHYVGVFSDISVLRASQDRLEYLAHHDVLTGLPNRVQLSRQLSAAIARARESGRGFDLLFIDLDHFKHVNDTLGHSLGDMLLHQVGGALRACLNESVVARVGGDEFVAVLEPVGCGQASGTDPATDAATAVLAALSNPFSVDEHQLYVGASVGIVRYPEHGETAEVLLAHADAAMYRAKSQGRNSWCVYCPEMSDQARDRLALGASLRRAIDEERLFLQYQPQIEISSGKLVGVEALVRMRHPTLGVIGPAKFIELAEEDGTIRRLGHWVLREACHAMARWREAGVPIPKVAINVSVSQLERSDLTEVLTALLQESGLSAHCIEIEITESVIMNAEDAIGQLNQLRALGVSLAIDDFGTGYSSLSYLRRLPVQKLKIDRSFFVDMAQQADAVAVVRSIVGLAGNLGLTTVAEGVETESQLALLRAEGCDVVQGYLLSKALDEDELIEFCGGERVFA